MAVAALFACLCPGTAQAQVDPAEVVERFQTLCVTDGPSFAAVQPKMATAKYEAEIEFDMENTAGQRSRGARWSIGVGYTLTSADYSLGNVRWSACEIASLNADAVDAQAIEAEWARTLDVDPRPAGNERLSPGLFPVSIEVLIEVATPSGRGVILRAKQNQTDSPTSDPNQELGRAH